MQAIRFRVQNFRNIDDSGWVTLEQVTTFVGRNESGKTTLLKALHKFNPATAEPYDPMREFPRDRYVRDYVNNGSRGGDWPACSVTFKLDEDDKRKIVELLEDGQLPPVEVVGTRYYDGSIKLIYSPEIEEGQVVPKAVLEGLKNFAKATRRIEASSSEHEESTAEIRTSLLQWYEQWQDRIKPIDDLRNSAGVDLLAKLRKELESKSSPLTANLVEELQDVVEPVYEASKKGHVVPKLDELILEIMPVLIYFENYGVLESAIYLPRFLEDLQKNMVEPKVRTISAMFKHVGLDPREIASLGDEKAREQRANGHQPTPEVVAADQRRKEERAIRLNSASNDISSRFSDWWSQRRHKIRYHADGNYFRIWIADDRRPDVEIELEARSKGFQWFFSFYLVFLVESQEGHRDAILLLDEPGLNLHPTAQQELLGFFDKLSEQNQLAYTTHSPFLVDGEHIHRVRPVTEDETGHSRISSDSWPKDRETIFPLQAAAGYAMLRGLFKYSKNILVEGMTDYYYLHALSHQCRVKGFAALPEDVYVTPCGGTKNVGFIASLFLGQEVRPLVLLDADEAGRVRRDALLKMLYQSHNKYIVMLDEALGCPGNEVEVEDVIGESLILPVLNSMLSRPLSVSNDELKTSSLPKKIKIAAAQQGIELPEEWKTSVALDLVSTWAQQGVMLPDKVLESASKLFSDICSRFSPVMPNVVN